MITNKLGKPVSQRQLRVGEMIKQSLGMIFLRNEAKVPIWKQIQLQLLK